jgi:hypothetical protein
MAEPCSGASWRSFGSGGCQADGLKGSLEFVAQRDVMLIQGGNDFGRPAMRTDDAGQKRLDDLRVRGAESTVRAPGLLQVLKSRSTATAIGSRRRSWPLRAIIMSPTGRSLLAGIGSDTAQRLTIDASKRNLRSLCGYAELMEHSPHGCSNRVVVRVEDELPRPKAAIQEFAKTRGG